MLLVERLTGFKGYENIKGNRCLKAVAAVTHPYTCPREERTEECCV